MRGIEIGILLTASLALSSIACTVGGQSEGSSQSAPSGGRGSSQAVPITVAPAVQKAVPLEIRVIGSVEPSSSVAIRAQVTGVLTDVTFEEGDDVREGQLLFSLDRRPLEAALAQGEATLRRDTARAENAAAMAKRAEELANRGIATREQVDTAETNAHALEATLAADRAAIENARVQLQYASITAPISGRTGALQVHPGSLVRANDTTSLVVINQITPIFVSFSVPGAQLSMMTQYLAKGDVHVEAEPPSDGAAPSQGHITFVDNAVDPTTGAIRVKGSFENADRRLWPGQAVKVVMTLATDPTAIVVPSVAVQGGQQGSYVFVVKDDKTVDVRPVQVGRATGDNTIITNGLAAGETVVTDGQIRLVAGSSVSIKDSPIEAAR
ncbi:MAG: efflux RND transporter periplasmic adaptor subunit [Vicinamibacterales bacterium]